MASKKVDVPLADRPVSLSAWISTGELARLLDVKIGTLRKLHRDGVLPPAIRIGTRLLRWRREDIQQWMANLRPEETAK
jgi:excisionase family DNA binding protein